MTRPAPLFHGTYLKADVFAAAAGAGFGKLLVTFRQRVADPGRFSDLKPVQSFLRQGYSHLAIQSRDNDWYINPETEALAASLRDFSAKFGQSLAFGFSMGGYAALRFSRDLLLNRVIAVSPQVSIAPEIVPFDRRYRHEAAGFDAGLGNLARFGHEGLQGLVLFDPFRTLDRGNAAMIGAIFPGLSLCRLGFGGHPATQVIGETAGFGAVQKLVLQGRISRAQILALHRRNRAASPAYWAALAGRCRAGGHLAAADAAAARLAMLWP
ncbi:MAG: alpha/beta hydrolase [Paracoccaceae bacterium]|nr:alpha/beta hydrolase [Paracoccaceae bacterium]